ncbi:NAD(+)/NADH kinase [Winogradskya consettensis]|uniref:NAD kinase n=1 Tax=Winogradskya consettensis TaxID=113560 RepID=A0A919STT6_9ACTN|nr:NAD(+)/NADH kinase [Actinoplanes consettensis]GIM77804.1 NAD kinase [Actinoplanes consettensis]
MSLETAVKTFGLVVHPNKPVGDSVATIVEWSRTHEGTVLIRESEAARITTDGLEVVGDEEFLRRVNGVIALGGDGTMLGAMRLVIDRPVPVLGVNHGNLGFLVEITPSSLAAALEQLGRGDFTIESHGCLVADAGPVRLRTSFGFNDVVLARLGRKGAVSADLTVNGRQYGYYRCDAVVVSTPNGSTAYNYAAGGPILSPSAAATVITPVAPMAGIGRAVVLGAGDQITLTVAPDSAPVAVDVDGTDAGELAAGGVLSARFREDAAQVVRLSAGTHQNRSQIKLSLLDLPLRRDQLLELIPENLRHNAALHDRRAAQ